MDLPSPEVTLNFIKIKGMLEFDFAATEEVYI